MDWRGASSTRWLEADLPRAKVVFSTRDTGSVREDVGPLAAALELEPGRIASSRQVHGAELVRHDGRLPQSSSEADGHVLAEPGLAAMVFVADCLPVAVSGPGGAAILHCGWRGLAAGIVARGAAAVEATHAAIGPGIGPCCYEVGEEVLAPFRPLGDGVATERMLDLPEVARLLLRGAGVERIESAGLCTRCEPDLFFSHRRDGGPGRQAGLVWLKPEEA